MSEAPKSALASLVADVMTEKKAAAKLTPVDGEARPTRAALPNDTGLFLSNEQLREHAVQLRKFAADAIVIADGIDKLVTSENLPPSSEAPELGKKPVDLDAARKQKEFEADLRAKERAAQEAVFKAPADDTETEDPPETPAPATDEWVCPTHQKPGIEKTSTVTGRKFIGCPDCNLFKRR